MKKYLVQNGQIDIPSFEDEETALRHARADCDKITPEIAVYVLTKIVRLPTPEVVDA